MTSHDEHFGPSPDERLPRSYDEASLAGVERVDVVISPCVNQNLSAFPLVLGNDNIARLCARLRPHVLVPLTNAEFEAEGAHSFCGTSTAPYSIRENHPVQVKLGFPNSLYSGGLLMHFFVANVTTGPASSSAKFLSMQRARFLHQVQPH